MVMKKYSIDDDIEYYQGLGLELIKRDGVLWWMDQEEYTLDELVDRCIQDLPGEN